MAPAERGEGEEIGEREIGGGRERREESKAVVGHRGGERERREREKKEKETAFC